MKLNEFAFDDDRRFYNDGDIFYSAVGAISGLERFDLIGCYIGDEGGSDLLQRSLLLDDRFGSLSFENTLYCFLYSIKVFIYATPFYTVTVSPIC
jgi:hypothetical protein